MPKKIKNFRDLGGIPAADGKHIRSGMLFRSGHLARIKPKTADRMRDKMGLRAVVDLRSPSELAEHPDVVADGVDYCHLPPLNDEQNPSINKKNRRPILYRIMALDGGARGYLSDTYRTMVATTPPLEAFAELIHLLLEEDNGAVLWHCTQGKDRTGIASAAVLLALGVDRDEIMRDYMRTNRSCRIKNWLIYLGVTLVTLSIHTASSLNLLLTSQRDYLRAAFDEMDNLYGGTEGFLHDGLGLTNDDIGDLRRIYLE
ncbi:MAG: tyrosine-protein phosphatase [Clostridia bacterium]|nr:tyrosine-protein phosphatase [Clostridia bacterium]